jgi:predicted GIY-YIG superfamily endonuclease
MGFWAYMLHCGDGSFYAGHTDDLDCRVAQHLSGEFGGYTSTRLPVKLVWCDEFPSRYEALSAERQIKGWGRAKKLALIRGDWELVSQLARNSTEKEKDRASTSSAPTGLGDRHPLPTRPPPWA